MYVCAYVYSSSATEYSDSEEEGEMEGEEEGLYMSALMSEQLQLRMQHQFARMEEPPLIWTKLCFGGIFEVL